jgi:hypothetical protein
MTFRPLSCAFIRALTLAALLVPSLAWSQTVTYFHQFATGVENLVADETGTYMIVDDTRLVFNATGLFLPNRALSLRRYNNANGAETDNVAGLGLALDSTGIYISLTEISPRRRPVVLKYRRDGTLLWRIELSNSNQERVHNVAAANGFVYAETIRSGAVSVSFIYRIDPATGAILAATESTPFFAQEFTADSTGLYGLTGGPSGGLRKWDLNGNFVWERKADNGNSLSPEAILAHPTGIYAGGLQFPDGSGVITRFDRDGNRIFSTNIVAAGQVTIRGLFPAPDGIWATGVALDGLPGLPPIGDNDLFVRKYSFDGTAQSTFLIGQPTFGFFQPEFAVVGGAVQIGGTGFGTWPGNAPDTLRRALLAQVTLPPPPIQSLTSIFNTFPPHSGNSFRNRMGSICNQLSSLVRDLESQRGRQLPAQPADLALGKVGEVQTLLGCAQ